LLAAGSHALQAYYAGDNANFSSRSQLATQVVAVANFVRPGIAFPRSHAIIFGNLPTGDSAAVQFNDGHNAPILSATNGRLIFQVPWELSGQQLAAIFSLQE